ncbi:MAG TPA: DUF1189 family protein [Anaerolineales bacterium]|nr:DUF1189 family protein [Anaerolineales bacterium]
MEVPSEVVPVAEPNSVESGFLYELAWFASGAVLPMGSLSYYRRASRRSVGVAILFFFILTLVITTMTTINVAATMVQVVDKIREGYRQARVPTIVIRSGIAEVDGPQPFIIANQRTSRGAILIAVDTTGQMTGIDQSRYDQGLLLTKTEMHVLDQNGRYQRVPLSELNSMFQRDPIVIDENTVSNAWVGFSAAAAMLSFIGLVLWNSVVRLMIVATLALIFWGIGSLIRPKVGFGPFIITGMYALVPAIYIWHLFSRSHASFFGLQTILLLFFWAVGLVGALAGGRFFAANVLARLWTALIGLPMILVLAIDTLVRIPSQGWAIAVWVVTLLTMLALICVRLYFHLRDLGPSAIAAEPTSPQGPTPPPAAS